MRAETSRNDRGSCSRPNEGRNHCCYTTRGAGPGAVATDACFGASATPAAVSGKGPLGMEPFQFVARTIVEVRRGFQFGNGRWVVALERLTVLLVAAFDQLMLLLSRSCWRQGRKLRE